MKTGAKVKSLAPDRTRGREGLVLHVGRSYKGLAALVSFGSFAETISLSALEDL